MSDEANASERVGLTYSRVQISLDPDLVGQSGGTVVRLVEVAREREAWQPLSVVATWKMTRPALYAMTANVGSWVLSVVREEEFFIVVFDEDPRSASPREIYRGTGALAVPAAMRKNGQLFFGVMRGDGIVPVLFEPSSSASVGLVPIETLRMGEVF